MEPWFFREPERLRQERAAVIELAQRTDWLIGHEWRFVEGALCLDAVIEAHGYRYEVRVAFPPLFPDTAPVVRPLNQSVRLSGHQYGGADGPLCLEWGPDNWYRTLTASDMLASTYRLFDIENPLGRDAKPVAIAPSRHRLSVGQAIRSSPGRWYCGPSLRNCVTDQPRSAVGSFKFSFRRVDTSEWVVLVHTLSSLDGGSWADPDVPENIPEGCSIDWNEGAWFSTNATADRIESIDTLDDVRQLLPDTADASLLSTDGKSPIEGMAKPVSGVLLRDDCDELHLFVVLSFEDAFQCTRVESETNETGARRPESSSLGSLKVGIVGVGSIGSKVAQTLARMGVGYLYLVDHDVLLPENLARNGLDWQGVARLKVDAAKTSLLLLASSIQVELSRVHLTGQESNAVVGGVLTRLADCDVLVDATANPQVFNLLAAVARAAKRHMVWAEVFAGGVGGLIARSRPGLDPDPQRMRLAFLQYCDKNPAPESMLGGVAYALNEPQGNVLTASDADVGVLASHTARLLVDSVQPTQESRYPCSMYLLGLARGWVFREPFDTIPIGTKSLLEVGPEEAGGVDWSPDDTQFLIDALAKKPSA